MSELITDDWKLKARTVVKLYRENIHAFVSLYSYYTLLSITSSSAAVAETTLQDGLVMAKS